MDVFLASSMLIIWSMPTPFRYKSLPFDIKLLTGFRSKLLKIDRKGLDLDYTVSFK